MMMLARKRPSPVIQVTVKQTETDPGLIGVVSPNKKSWRPANVKAQCRPTLCPDFYHVSLNSEFSSMQDCSKSDETAKTVEGDYYLSLGLTERQMGNEKRENVDK